MYTGKKPSCFHNCRANAEKPTTKNFTIIFLRNNRLHVQCIKQQSFKLLFYSTHLSPQIEYLYCKQVLLKGSCR